MTPASVEELVSVLNQEIAIGEKLARNLDAQRQAIIDWDAARLLEQVEARELDVKSLAVLEERRRELLLNASATGEPVTLRRIMSALSDDQQRLALSNLRERIRQIFTRLSAEEGMLRKLMDSLLTHIQNALAAFPEPRRAMYDESGLARDPADRYGLYHNKA
jgi:FlgN protein